MAKAVSPVHHADRRRDVVGHDLENLNGGHGGPKDPRVLFTPGVPDSM